MIDANSLSATVWVSFMATVQASAAAILDNDKFADHHTM
jgi:hypothetical protein